MLSSASALSIALLLMALLRWSLRSLRLVEVMTAAAAVCRLLRAVLVSGGGLLQMCSVLISRVCRLLLLLLGAILAIAGRSGCCVWGWLMGLGSLGLMA